MCPTYLVHFISPFCSNLADLHGARRPSTVPSLVFTCYWPRYPTLEPQESDSVIQQDPCKVNHRVNNVSLTSGFLRLLYAYRLGQFVV